MTVTQPYRQQSSSIVRFLDRLLQIFGYGIEEEEKSEQIFAISALLYEQSIALGAWGLVAVAFAGTATRIGIEIRRNKQAKKTDLEVIQTKIEAMPSHA